MVPKAKSQQTPGHRHVSYSPTWEPGPPALALDKNRPPYSRMPFHRVHISGIPKKTRLLHGGEPRSSPPAYSVVRETRIWQWSVFTPPRHAASVALLGLFLLRRVQNHENHEELKDNPARITDRKLSTFSQCSFLHNSLHVDCQILWKIRMHLIA
jgi:hypothetical protein